MTLLSGCGQAPGKKLGDKPPAQFARTPGYEPQFGVPVGAPAARTSVDIGQGEIIQAQQSQARKAWVTVRAQVYRMLRYDDRPPCHQKFLLKLDNGTTVEVAHNTDIAPQVPVSPGDVVTIRGEYIWTPKGGVLHWTHHDPDGTEPGGWIDFNGQQYK